MNDYRHFATGPYSRGVLAEVNIPSRVDCTFLVPHYIEHGNPCDGNAVTVL